MLRGDRPASPRAVGSIPLARAGRRPSRPHTATSARASERDDRGNGDRRRRRASALPHRAHRAARPSQASRAHSRAPPTAPPSRRRASSSGRCSCRTRTGRRRYRPGRPRFASSSSPSRSATICAIRGVVAGPRARDAGQQGHAAGRLDPDGRGVEAGDHHAGEVRGLRGHLEGHPIPSRRPASRASRATPAPVAVVTSSASSPSSAPA